MNSEALPKRLPGLFAVLPTVAVIAITALIVTYMMGSTTEAKRTRPERAARLVEVTGLSAGDHTISIEAWGTVQPSRQVSLQPQVAGEVQAIGEGLEPGARVKAGELLVKVDPSDYELTVRQRRSELTRARAELAQEQGRRAVAEQEFTLLEGEVTPAQRRLMLREPQLETARAAVASAEAALAEAELNLKRTEVRAPFNALVLERGVNIGTRVTSGSTLATVAGTDAYWVELTVPASSLRWLEIPGATVRLYHESVWGRNAWREGRVIRLRGDLEDRGRMARLLVEVKDPLGVREPDRPALLLGAFLRAEITGRTLAGALALDRAWLRDDDTLWLMTPDNRLTIRPVEVLYRGADRVFLRDGVKPGERLVTSDLAVPAEGMPLRAAGDPDPSPGERQKPAGGGGRP